MLDLAMLVLGAFARVHVRDVKDSLLGRIQNLEDVVRIGPGIEEIPDVERLEVFVTIQLLIVGIGEGIELCLIFGRQNGFCIAAEIGPGHRNQMHLVARDQCAQMRAQLVIRVGRDVVKLVYRDEPIIKRFNPELVHGEPKGRVGADQNLVVARQKLADSADLAVIPAGSVA